MRVLGIETSCDDTGAAIYDGNQGLIIHRLASQIDVHQPYGGVVPELAARDHIRSTATLVQTLLQSSENQEKKIDAIAYTQGPGLAGALLVGASFGRSLAMAMGIKAIGVHHMEGHLLAPMLEAEAPKPPFVALLVSGGHTLLVNVQAIGNYRVLGHSVDDAAGEAFDKTAKLLGLPYPGGPSIAKHALHGIKDRFQFPRPMVNRPGLDFSFSGLKTFTLTTAQSVAKSGQMADQDVADICHAFQDAVCDTLTIKCLRALKQTGHNTLVVAGGVGANRELRARLQSAIAKQGGQVFYPRPEFCTDNGAMIAYAGWARLNGAPEQALDNLSFDIKPRWSLEDLPPLSP